MASIFHRFCWIWDAKLASQIHPRLVWLAWRGVMARRGRRGRRERHGVEGEEMERRSGVAQWDRVDEGNFAAQLIECMGWQAGKKMEHILLAYIANSRAIRDDDPSVRRTLVEGSL